MLETIVQAVQTRQNLLINTADEGSHKAWLVASLFRSVKQNLVMVLPDQKSAQTFSEDLQFFMPDLADQIKLFPGYQIKGFQALSLHKGTASQRLKILWDLSQGSALPMCIVTCVETVLQKEIPKQVLTDFSELIMLYEDTDLAELTAKLEAGGYTRTSLVEEPGDYAVRGGLLDVFSPSEALPVRVEFFGDTVDSIRYFSPYTQRSTKDLSEIILIPASEAILPEEELPHILARIRKTAANNGIPAEQIRQHINTIRETGRLSGIETLLPVIYEKLDTFFDYLSDNEILILDHGNHLQTQAEEFHSKIFLEFENARNQHRLCVEPSSFFLSWEEFRETYEKICDIRFTPLVMEQEKQQAQVISFPCRDQGDLTEQLKNDANSETPLQALIQRIEQYRDQGFRTILVPSGKTRARQLAELLAPYGVTPELIDKLPPDMTQKKPGLYCVTGSLEKGFSMENQAVAIITEKDIFGTKRVIRKSRTSARDAYTQLAAPEELKNGNIVVHTEHGLCRYEGLCRLNLEGLSQDFIKLMFQDDDVLYLPVDRIEVIGKYVGMEGYSPVLDKIGGKSWGKAKAKAKAEVEKMAADLLDLYARRKANNGVSFSPPDRAYLDFEASFPYEETPDQLKAIQDVNQDMESPTPMDRLVCGDVGYGKTEVAIRAVFKAVNDGRQAAVVVPTTILAEQHLATFQERFASWPFNIACLSRFRTRKEQARILADLKSGRTDVVIGTHRLLQKDVGFQNLGLLVIDEEQRFGVKHKEVLKKKRSQVDVLALSATPIPRTLHLSLTGMRDISIMATPPALRQPIFSYVSPYDDRIIKDAIEKEIARNGQVFFVHNNIMTIQKQAAKLAELVPQAKIGIAHGRLSETELEKIMFQFIHFEINVLVCTTIIESGLDIPSANTMIINKVERFGLSQIYQLRGRIGRGDHQAYAYLFVSDESRLTQNASKRLAAIMEHKDLGSGFQIAMKDLQIRGAGTALGASQSGHIAAVGYTMFLDLLDHAVQEMKGEPVQEPLEPEINVTMSSGFPEDYIESVEQRLTLYRRLSRLTSLGEISDMKKEMEDRYGPLPTDAQNMLMKIMLRVYAIRAGVRRLDITPSSITLGFSMSHRPQWLEAFRPVLYSVAAHKVLAKDTIQCQFKRKTSQIGPALKEAKRILGAIIPQT